ncbi:MAG: prepilin-type N-terminal cleavage/methylation domain-containing protein, partial [Gemmatimonadota bacterium]
MHPAACGSNGARRLPRAEGRAHMNARPGFTMVEILTVIAVLAILSA